MILDSEEGLTASSGSSGDNQLALSSSSSSSEHSQASTSSSAAYQHSSPYDLRRKSPANTSGCCPSGESNTGNVSTSAANNNLLSPPSPCTGAATATTNASTTVLGSHLNKKQHKIIASFIGKYLMFLEIFSEIKIYLSVSMNFFRGWK